MGQKYIKNKSKGCVKIKASLFCFQDKPLDILAKECLQWPLIADKLIDLRNLGKRTFAMRMKKAAKSARSYKKIEEKSLTILLDFLNNNNFNNASRFVECFFSFYNSKESEKLYINEPKLSSNDKYKSLKSGMKDCLKAFDTYFKPILDKIKANNCEEICDDIVVGKYEDIKFALTFSMNYIFNFHCNALPKRIEPEIFEIAKNKDCKLINLYNLNDLDSMYELNNNKNIKYTAISQDCATYLICYTELMNDIY